MIKKILGLIAAVIVTVVAIVNVNIDVKKSGLSNLSLANVEVLARNEVDWLFCDVMTPCVWNVWYDCVNYWITDDGRLIEKICEYRWAQ